MVLKNRSYSTYLQRYASNVLAHLSSCLCPFGSQTSNSKQTELAHRSKQSLPIWNTPLSSRYRTLRPLYVPQQYSSVIPRSVSNSLTSLIFINPPHNKAHQLFATLGLVSSGLSSLCGNKRYLHVVLLSPNFSRQSLPSVRV
jgi:hypothetical protein